MIKLSLYAFLFSSGNIPVEADSKRKRNFEYALLFVLDYQWDDQE